MKICPRCQKTYADEDLNFCLDDGATLTFSIAVDNPLPATVLLTQPRPTASNQNFESQSGSQSGWNNPNQFSMQPPPRKSKNWLWALGIIGGLILLCGGGSVGFIAWVASLPETDANYNGSKTVNTPQNTSSDKTTRQVIDLSKWVKGDTDIGTTEYSNGRFIMGSKQPGYYYVLVSQAIYKTENAITKVTVKNINEDSTTLGFGLVVHSNPIPLTQDYAFLIDSESQKYRVVRHLPGEEIVVVGWTRSSAIKNGDAENVLEVRDENKKMNFYINGEFIKTVDNKDGYSGGVAGLYSGDAVQAAFSNFEIKK